MLQCYGILFEFVIIVLDWLFVFLQILLCCFYWCLLIDVVLELFNKLLVCDDGCIGCIVEVEVYVGSDDFVVYFYCGLMLCMVSMFGEVGYFYVYFMYGMYWGSNVVCGEVGEGVVVLLWVVELLVGLECMYKLCFVVCCDYDLVSGFGKFLQVFGLDCSFDGVDLVIGSYGIVIVSDGILFLFDLEVGLWIGILCVVDFFW